MPSTAAPTMHDAVCELNLARTYAANLHLARTERQLIARVDAALDCARTARRFAVACGALSLATEAETLAAAIAVALTHTDSLPATVAA